jgi:hypothetical protein
VSELTATYKTADGHMYRNKSAKKKRVPHHPQENNEILGN